MGIMTGQRLCFVVLGCLLIGAVVAQEEEGELFGVWGWFFVFLLQNELGVLLRPNYGFLCVSFFAVIENIFRWFCELVPAEMGDMHKDIKNSQEINKKRPT